MRGAGKADPERIHPVVASSKIPATRITSQSNLQAARSDRRHNATHDVPAFVGECREKVSLMGDGKALRESEIRSNFLDRFILWES